MKPTNNWANTAASNGQSERLTAGGHICRIKHAEAAQSRAGREMLKVYIDIAEGTDKDGFFERKWKMNTAKKWPNDGTIYQLTTDKDGNTNPRFKGLIESVERSNGSWKWTWDENQLKGKLIGVVFGEEEYQGSDGQIRTAIKPRYTCAAGKAMEQPAPTPHTLAERPEEPAPAAQETFTEVQDDELPFE